MKSEPKDTVPPAAYLSVFLAWAVPGGGHFFLGRRLKAVAFFALVLLSMGIGSQLAGKLPTVMSGSPLAVLATLGAMGTGLPYFVLRFVLDYQGDPGAWGFEYGTAFILTAGLMNLLLMLDAWDLARGRKL